MNSKSSPKLEFINHASVLISYENIGLLSDPWYQGDAFHKGWNLLHELKDNEIEDLLNRTSHIWISHEHPDHFSIMFFKKFGEKIKERNIQILFQNTEDKRVEGFLKANKFDLKILDFNKWISIAKDFSILNFKDGFYDSGLAANVCGKKFLNLNDCEVKNSSRCKEVLDIVGECDVLISQFSYAAWKGGKDNIQWRKKAAKEKLDTLSLQTKFFKPKLLIPFASYIYFSNKANDYLNDASNTPNDVLNHFKKKSEVSVKIMKPFDVLQSFSLCQFNNEEALKFWSKAFNKIQDLKKETYKTIIFEDLNQNFKIYKDRIFKNNSKLVIKLLSIFSPISVFKPLYIYLEDHNKTIRFDLFYEKLDEVEKEADISMSSESLDFIMKNTFGFDTLTVNGCFEELKKGGFSKMTKVMAIENLNNIGVPLRFSIFLRFDIIYLFIGRLFMVNKKINNTN